MTFWVVNAFLSPQRQQCVSCWRDRKVARIAGARVARTRRAVSQGGWEHARPTGGKAARACPSRKSSACSVSSSPSSPNVRLWAPRAVRRDRVSPHGAGARRLARGRARRVSRGRCRHRGLRPRSERPVGGAAAARQRTQLQRYAVR